MFFQEATPDTSGYMIAGYVIAFVVMALYVASMYLRSHNLKQDISMLEEMDKAADAPVQKQRAAKPVNPRPTKTVTKKRAKKA